MLHWIYNFLVVSQSTCEARHLLQCVDFLGSHSAELPLAHRVLVAIKSFLVEPMQLADPVAWAESMWRDFITTWCDFERNVHAMNECMIAAAAVAMQYVVYFFHPYTCMHTDFNWHILFIVCFALPRMGDWC